MINASATAYEAAGDDPDWSELPEEILLMFMEALEIPDIVRAGAVCASWHTAYAAFRCIHLPLPISRKQLPCLLYACQDYAPDSAVLCCPFTGDSVRVPLPLPPLTRHCTVGSAYGWLVTADEAANLQLLNPVTGAQAALPPITGIHHVEICTDVDADGRLLYNVFYRGDPEPIPFQCTRARPGTACYNGTMCLPTKDFPTLKSNCAYITDDSCEYVNMCKHNWREIGVWDMECRSLQSFDSALLPHSWLNWPSPVWITPSLF
ncbi:hypothetical protein QYE76_064172 [Lolium multiflorum]|uniref:F-box protein n=1 Tax=Lolium multiflorum TaxID=4521 RepID=A0AAD8WA01_LOLMU|nr:hypothetical protein QYE76_064172 [Lolium multiflorum]